MFLKRIEISGFKSFTERTVVPFTPGISAVVGPNGCGKSNIIDAIRWVMGEQSPRLLRARNMEDLLFNGSKGKPPAALAEVVLTLARDTERGQAEISVTRRLYRSGDSEYQINRNPARLKDVARFFIEAGMGTRAYAIIEQEKVGRLVDARADERRLLLDEAAGVTRYKEQKKESEKKLESASRNLETVALLMADNSKQLAAVSRQAARALKHRAIREELRSLELTLAARGHLQLGSARRELAAARDAALAEARSLAARAAGIEAECEALKLEDSRAGLLLEEGLSAFHALDGAHEKARAELEHLRRSSAEAAERAGTVRAELAGQEGQREAYRADRERLAALAAELEAESAGSAARAEAAGRELSLARERHGAAEERVRAAARGLDGLKDSLARAGEGLAGCESLAGHLAERRRALELERNEMDYTLREAQERAAARTRARKALEDDLAALEAELASRREAAAAGRAAAEAAVSGVSAADSRAAGLKARLETLESLERQFAWHPPEVSSLLGRRDLRERGVVGPVAGSVRIPPGAEEAAEAFLGQRLSWLLVEDRRAALAALRAAQEGRLGVYGFVCRSELGDRPLAEALLGGEIELADPPAGAAGEPAVPGAHGKTGLPRDAGGGPAAGRAGGRAEARAGPEDGPAGGDRLWEILADLPDGRVILTRDGTFLSRTVVAGGARPAKGKGDGKGLLARLREKEEAEAQAAAAREELEALRALAAEARGAREAADEALAAKTAERNSLASDLSKANERLVEAVSNEKGLRIRAGALSSELQRVEADAAKGERRREEFRLDKERLDGELAAAAERLEALRRESAAAGRSLGEIQERENAASRASATAAEKLEGARRELKAAERYLGDLDGRRRSLESEAARLAAQEADRAGKIATLAAEAEGLPGKIAEARDRVKALRDEKEALRAGLAEREDALRQARKGREEGQESLNALEKDLLEAEYRLARIKDNVFKDWHAEFRIPGEDPEEPRGPAGTGTPGEAGEPQPPQGAGLPGGPARPGRGAGPPEGRAPEAAGAGRGGAAGDYGTGAEGAAPPEAALGPAVAEELLAESRGERLEYARDRDGAPGAGEPRDRAAAPPREPAPAPPELIDPRQYAGTELPPDAEGRAARLRERLNSLGEVNAAAIEEERELRKKCGFYEVQYLDLQKAISDLRDGIERINAVCRERFTETFTSADSKFQEIFPVLFEGGEGWLLLSEGQDPLEAGVEIRVHPPGKKITVMSLLSGGEKALTALALIFALYLIRPSPFCLLDEADAPLDEANIDRFNRLLRRLSESSQIIMVTHNKRTMQISDTLYGVTMETPGVSRLVSVSLSQAEALTR
ncbi:MAG: AAA family ATPase [Deltaproteobacteria bacterium]|jgi:chromosome segregation protein|nr:AAA family ATPase [Deltaproteobacteria bacterium]